MPEKINVLHLFALNNSLNEDISHTVELQQELILLHQCLLIPALVTVQARLQVTITVGFINLSPSNSCKLQSKFPIFLTGAAQAAAAATVNKIRFIFLKIMSRSRPPRPTILQIIY